MVTRSGIYGENKVPQCVRLCRLVAPPIYRAARVSVGRGPGSKTLKSVVRSFAIIAADPQ